MNQANHECDAMQTAQRILDVVLGVLLVVGCTLALPIYGWLFSAPLQLLWKSASRLKVLFD